jgi:hypothetical protein
MSGVYAMLGFPTNDPVSQSGIENLSPKVQTQIEMMPPLLTSWQEADLISNETETYFKNPCANSTQIIWNASNSVNYLSTVSFANVAAGTLYTYIQNKNALISSNLANSFMIHTNRMSNVTPLDIDVEKPHYESAIGYGKIIMYITSQTDNIQNNSPMMGSFTSIFFANNLTTYATNYQANVQIFLNTITANTITDPETGGTTTTYSSNLTLSQAKSFANSVNSVILMETYRSQDNTFFQNSKTVVDRYNKVSQFNKIGQTEQYLINNFIGTPQLSANIANTTNS